MPVVEQLQRTSEARRLRVAHVVLCLDVGGLERMVLRLLARTDRSRFDPFVIALDHEGALAPELEALDVPIEVVKRRDGLDPKMPAMLAKRLIDLGAGVVHTHNATPHLYGALAAQLSRLAGSRVAVVHTKHGRNAPDERRKVFLNRVASKLSDRVVAVSDDARAVAIDIEHVDPKKVVTILNGVDTNEFAPGGDVVRARDELGTPRAGFHVGCVARLAEVKDHANLLSAFATLRARVPDAHLTLVGDGEERANLEALAEELRVDGAVTFAGVRSDVARLLPAFDVFALGSRSEGISLTLLEAASAGLPIVATDVGGNREVVVDGRTGLLVPPRDSAALAAALERVVDADVRRAMGSEGRARVRDRFSIEEMTRKYQDLYASLTA